MSDADCAVIKSIDLLNPSAFFSIINTLPFWLFSKICFYKSSNINHSQNIVT